LAKEPEARGFTNAVLMFFYMDDTGANRGERGNKKVREKDYKERCEEEAVLTDKSSNKGKGGME